MREAQENGKRMKDSDFTWNREKKNPFILSPTEMQKLDLLQEYSQNL